MRMLTWLAATLLGAQVAGAEERALHFGIGYDDLFQKRTPSLGASVEYVAPAFGLGGNFRFSVAGMATVDTDLWIGAGILWTRPIGRGPWFVEASFLTGVFYREDEKPGAGNVHLPMFRTLGAVGYDLGNGRSVSVALSHHSAAKLDPDAGNTETIWIRYGKFF